MIFIENTYLEQYGLNPLDIVALSTYLNNDGFALANAQEIIWKYTDPFERVLRLQEPQRQPLLAFIFFYFFSDCLVIFYFVVRSYIDSRR